MSSRYEESKRRQGATAMYAVIRSFEDSNSRWGFFINLLKAIARYGMEKIEEHKTFLVYFADKKQNPVLKDRG